MERELWNERRGAVSDAAWQLYHENSKSSRFDRPLTDKSVAAWQRRLRPSLEYAGHPAVNLPAPHKSFPKTLEQAILDRSSALSLERRAVTLETLASFLTYSYGMTRRNGEGAYPPGFRAVPSAGALYPLELYAHVAAVDGLPAGLYHYEPAANVVRRFIDGDLTEDVATRVVQGALVRPASFVVFITGLFARSTTKYGERGYRFTLLEAGHVAQNLALVASALDLGGLNIGGFVDRLVDELLGIDGVNHSTLYVFAVGGKGARGS